ncbi:hypothetical protein LCGC14_1523760 [marine sediment metagenome]|uniref:PD-(D/E)XK endonuclease-like domain-containing protein n=1 Tax=marine sediment metagenome TaxID=412755 RepID=A0A0F9LDC1_9ZZZZ
MENLWENIRLYLEKPFPERHDLGLGRFYQVEDLYKPSDTTILNVIDKGYGFKKWLGDSHGYEKAQEYAEFTADRGTRVHLNASELLDGFPIQTDHEENVMPEFEIKCLLGFIKWHEDYKPEILANEICLYDPTFPTAGTADIICLMDGKPWKQKGNVLALLDIKTGKDWPIHQLQLTGYGLKFEGLFEEKPYLATLGLYEYRKDIKYRLKTYDYDEGAFVNAYNLWCWQNNWTEEKEMVIPEELPKILTLDMLEEKEDGKL